MKKVTKSKSGNVYYGTALLTQKRMAALTPSEFKRVLRELALLGPLVPPIKEGEYVVEVTKKGELPSTLYYVYGSEDNLIAIEDVFSGVSSEADADTYIRADLRTASAVVDEVLSQHENTHKEHMKKLRTRMDGILSVIRHAENSN